MKNMLFKILNFLKFNYYREKGTTQEKKLLEQIVKLISKKWLLAISLFFISFVIDFYSVINNRQYAFKVYAEIESNYSKKLVEADLYSIKSKRLKSKYDLKSMNGDTIKIDKKLPKYYTSIFVKIDKKKLEDLKQVSVIIGKTKFSFSKQSFLANWIMVKDNKNFVFMKAPKSVTLGQSIFPYLNNYINWGGDFILYFKLFFNSIFIALLFWFIISFLNNSFYFSFTNQIVKKEYITILLLSLLIGIYRVPFSIIKLGYDLDNSWLIGLSVATNLGLNWGKDIVFTFGPLHWLLYPSIILSQHYLILSFILNCIISWLSIYYIVKYIIKKWSTNPSRIIYLFLCLVILIISNYTFLDIIICSVCLILINNIYVKNKYELLVAGFLLAISSQIKVSYIAFSFIVSLIFYLIILYRKKSSFGGIVFVSFIANFLLIWVLSGQKLNNFIPYLRGSFEVGLGYSEAMAYSTIHPFVSIGILILLYTGIIFFYKIKDFTFLYVNLIVSPIIFLSFKEGFVRDDGIHIERFFSQIILILLIFFIEFQKYKIINRINVFIIFCTIGIFPINKLNISSLNFKLLLNSDYRNKIIQQEKYYMRQHFNLDGNTLNYLKNSHSVDILPIDISLLYAYDIIWRPRPVIQSYSAYTEYLDILNASFYFSKNSPEYLLISNSTIDGRSVYQENPLTMRQIVSHYCVFNQKNENYLILKKCTTSLPKKDEFVKINQLGLNQSFLPDLNDNKDYYLFGNIKKSLLGNIIGFFYRIPPLYLNIQYNTGEIKSIRLVRENLKNGVPLIALPNSNACFRNYFNNESLQYSNKKLISIRIDGNNYFYNVGQTTGIYEKQ